LVLDEVAERALLFVAERGFERKRLLDEFEQLPELVERYLHLVGKLLSLKVLGIVTLGILMFPC
jgi:hypothetical protein